MPELKIETGARAGESFSFSQTIIIGRGPLADLTLAEPTVSRRHAMLHLDDDDYCMIHDLDSENGTFLNDRRVTEPQQLRNGDRLRFGRARTLYEAEDSFVDHHTNEKSIVLFDKPVDRSLVLLSMSMEQAETDRSLFGARPEESRRIGLFRELAECCSETLDEDTLVGLVLEKLFSILPQADRAFIMRWDEESEDFEPAGARNREGKQDGEIQVSRTLLKDVVDRKEGILITDPSENPRYAESESIYEINLHTAICGPIIFREKIFGVIQVDSISEGKPFSKDDLSLLLGVAAQIAMSLAYSSLHGRLLERQVLHRDVMLARKIQQHFLPKKVPTTGGYVFALDYTPALAVGGDFYTFLDLKNGRIGVAVGDVSGKGVSAALYMAKVASEIRYQATEAAEPHEIVENLNDALARDAPEGMFITLVMLSIDTGTGKLAFANGGHLLPIVREESGEVVCLGESGDPPLGVIEGKSFHQFEYEIEPTDRVVLFTDGVTEAMNASQEMFGDDRLADETSKSDGTVSGVVDSILGGLKSFVRSAPQFDDITLLCFGRED